MTLRSHLSLLVAAALTPMLVFAVVAAVLLQKDERDTMAQNGIGRARSTMSAVDAHLRGTIFALRTLAASKNLESGDVAAFHAEAQRVLNGDPAWVNLSLVEPSGVVLFNAVYAFGKPDPKPPQNDSYEITASGTKVAIGGVRTGSVVRNPTVRVHLPVHLEGKAGYVVVAPMNVKQIADVLQAQKVPEGWTLTLVDAEKHIIAAVPSIPTGSPLEDEVRAVLDVGAEGWSRTAEPHGAYVAHVTSELSNWVLAISIPTSYMEAGARRSLTVLALGALIALGVGVGLAWLVARRIPS